MQKLNKIAGNGTRAGFTLIEILLTMALMGIVAVFSFPILQQVISKNDLDTSTTLIVQNLRRAQGLAMGVANDHRWGVDFTAGTVAIFALDSDGNRIPEDDETLTVPSTISFSGLTNIVFKKFTGEPETAGSITVVNSINNENRIININEKGSINF